MNGRAHLVLAVPIYVLAIRYLSDAGATLLSPFLALYCILAMTGSLFPDIDWRIDAHFRGFGHRNPLTHSLLTPLVLYLMMQRLNISEPTVIACFSAFTLGVAAHMLGDLIKTGNLVWIPSRKHENMWYALNASALLILLYSVGFFATLQP